MISFRNGQLDSVKGYAVPSDYNDDTKAANFIVNFDNRPGMFNTTNYEVLNTDYSSYATAGDLRLMTSYMEMKSSSMF